MKNNQLNKKIAITIILLLVALLSHFSWLDNLAEEYTDQGIKRTLVTYAVSRSLNGVISVAQGTEVAISPAGVGFTFAPGQILDPVNDLIERFSWVVMMSGTSLGIQRIFITITSSSLIVWLLSFLCVFYVTILWLNKDKSSKTWQVHFKKLLILILFIRFSVPMIAVINEALYASFLQPQYEVAQSQLKTVSSNIEMINESSKKELQQNKDTGLMAKVEEWLDKTEQKLNLHTKINSLKQAADDISEQVINMIVIFVVQTIIFPLLFLWLLLKSVKWIMRSALF